MELIDGKKLAQTIREELAQEVQTITANGDRAPHLRVRRRKHLGKTHLETGDPRTVQSG